ncbi:VTC domain-containing protein [Dethiosulfatibacter aminovorans DSM 17477]|uniref:VTC domain-containing protein n=1 Tax=Dethiosulfatibacter aminovorans DSM 17477 TaxID=1121476 RepID=A0A1M6C5E0_9FIRM|nr:polyphosphate polymerase domain-containing protein [Dethiosulfatibacter aminovorans]SHI56240.1 VTC domain-containing protein [Dethiosulfatibacter aminovorans DSM 17477]
MSNSGYNYTFERVEKKYMLSKQKYKKFMKQAGCHITPDKYCRSSILNIYYDTDDYDLIRRSIDKPVYKEKLRLRSYGVPGKKDTVFLEIKKKYDGTVYKRRISLPLRDAVNYLESGIKPEERGQILKELDYFMSFYRPKAKLFLAYDREAYSVIFDSGLRITFDRNIRSRDYDLSLDKGDYGRPLLDDDIYIMEIKAAGAMPMWLVDILSDMEIYPKSFSKYGNIYKHDMNEKRRMQECLQVL